MLTIEVELLGGTYRAAAYDDRGQAEWPPHPARFFSALVAALHDRQHVDKKERAALRWLESQPAPEIEVALDGLGRRDVHEVFVPVNDTTVIGRIETSVRGIDGELVEARRELESLISAGAARPVTKKREAVVRKLEVKRAGELAKLATPDNAPSKRDVKAACALLPNSRQRKGRTFPVAIPGSPLFAFVWTSTPPAEEYAAFRRLAPRVTRLGHSTSLVRCAVVERPVHPTLVPDTDGSLVLRWVRPQQLERLEREHQRHQATEPRVLPSWPQPYRRSRAPQPPQTDLPRPVFGEDWIVFEHTGGAKLMGSRAGRLASVLRAALIEITNGDLPPSLSGHRPDGRPAETPHIALVALPHVGHPHAEGGILAVAIVPPRGLPPDERRVLHRAVANLETQRGKNGVLTLAAHGLPAMEVRRVEVPTRWTSTPHTWCRPSRHFTTATAIALDRNPGNLRSNVERTAHRACLEAQQTIAASCERIGLPRPSAIEVSSAPLLSGCEPAWAYEARARGPGRTRRVRVHATITFDQRVCGPVLLGAGRYLGLGLCLPVGDEE